MDVQVGLDTDTPTLGHRQTAHRRLMRMLRISGVSFGLMHHRAEGRTELVSRLRQHHLVQAAKCIVIRVGLEKKSRRYVLAVVSGDRRVDLDAVRCLIGGTKAVFAQRDVAERLAGSVSGSIVPFAFDPDLELIVDRDLLLQEELYFNAARLDLSVRIRTADYLTLARPRIARIAA